MNIDIFLVTEGTNKMARKYSNASNIDIFDSVMGAISKTTEAIDIVLKEDTLDVSHLCHLINTNHRLLESVKMGAEIIDEIVRLANKHKVGVKIAGAGFGGCMLAIYHGQSEVQKFKEAINELHDKGVSFIQAFFSKSGVQCDSWEYS